MTLPTRETVVKACLRRVRYTEWTHWDGDAERDAAEGRPKFHRTMHHQGTQVSHAAPDVPGQWVQQMDRRPASAACGLYCTSSMPVMVRPGPREAKARLPSAHKEGEISTLQASGHPMAGPGAWPMRVGQGEGLPPPCGPLKVWKGQWGERAARGSQGGVRFPAEVEGTSQGTAVMFSSALVGTVLRSLPHAHDRGKSLHSGGALTARTMMAHEPRAMSCRHSSLKRSY
jgi:hypothetical protein